MRTILVINMVLQKIHFIAITKYYMPTSFSVQKRTKLLTILKNLPLHLTMMLRIVEHLRHLPRFSHKSSSQHLQKVKPRNYISITRNHANIQLQTPNTQIKMNRLEEDPEKDRDDNLKGWKKEKVSRHQFNLDGIKL